jgi:hypothetical protein
MGDDGACMGEMFAKGVKKRDATEEVSFYISHGKCMLNQSTNFVSGFWERNSLGASYGKSLLE